MGKHNTRSTSCSSQEDHNNMTIDEKLNLLIDEVRQVKLGNSECLSEITKIKEDITLFKKDITDSLDMCFAKIKDCEGSIGNNANKLTDCETLIDNLRSENVTLRKSVAELKKRVVAGEQYSRNNCLEISGVPESRNEDICEIVKKVAKAVNYDLDNTMIDAAHRLSRNPNKPESPRGIIVRFCRRIDMEELRRRVRVKRSISAVDLGYRSENRIFVNLSLSKDTRQLWTEVRMFKNKNDFKYAWISNTGKIFLRKMEGRAAVLISEVSDLDRIK